MSKRAAEEEIGEAEKKQFDELAANGNGVHAVAEESIAADAVQEKSVDSKPILYHCLHFCSSRPLFVIHELGITDKIDVKEIPHADFKGEEYRAVNPLSTVPSLKLPDGRVILESGAITVYLLEKYGGLDHALWGKNEDRAKLLQWLWYAPATLYPAMSTAYGQDDKAKAECQEKLNNTHLAYIASELGDKPYLLGDAFTLADLFMGYELAGLDYLKFLAKFPNIQAYIDRLNARPSFKAAFKN